MKRIFIPAEGTIAEILVKTFSEHPKETFSYDKMIGTTTRKQFLLKAMVVSKIIKQEVDDKYVGIMLPALQSTTLLVAATYLAGKIPVMLNWTVGPKLIEHCVESVGVKKILTAKSFADKVADQLPESVKQKCVFFEEKVKTLSTTTKLKGLFAYFTKSLPKTKSTDVAVVLFTSGSESLPKAVKLTHKNVLTNLHGAFSHISLNTDVVMLSFLPPFHSFGFTVCTILPLTTAVKTAYTPDPTNGREVLKILNHTNANTLLGTPTFLKLLLAVAQNNELKNVRLVISGAESLQQVIAEQFKLKASPELKMLEGYGITECSPVLTLNPLEKQKVGSVGTFVKGVDFLITTIDTYTPVAVGSEGMILVRGGNIFSGYEDKNLASPFVTVNGIEYYKTGDLGYVDTEGYLFITGRLKRFIKIAGEMISLPAIENVLLNKYGKSDSLVLAVEGKDTIEVPQIVLFSVTQIEVNEANEALKQAGFSSLVKIHKNIIVSEIPLLGTGKTDYKVLKAMI
ncbi:MAG: AMP-binding protein [Bacteroidales bacterium]|nr:AMP-binding protein [Bacteroidales bacterium]